MLQRNIVEIKFGYYSTMPLMYLRHAHGVQYTKRLLFLYETEVEKLDLILQSKRM